MKTIKQAMSLLLLLLLLGIAGCSQKTGEKEPVSDLPPIPETGFTQNTKLIEEAAKSVYKLSVYNGDKALQATGSGFCMFEKDVLVTAAHILVNMSYIIATDEAGHEYRIEISDIKAADKDYDIALIRLKETTAAEPLPYDTGEPPRGLAVLSIGSQFGILNMVTTGVVSGIWHNELTDSLLFTAPVSPGASGGALFDDFGRVIGVIIGTYNSSQNLNIATPVKEAEKLYKSYIEEK